VGLKYWRPQILLLTVNPRSSFEMMRFCNDLKKGGLFIIGRVRRTKQMLLALRRTGTRLYRVCSHAASLGAGRGWPCMVVDCRGGLWRVVDCRGWLWLVVTGCGWLWLVVAGRGSSCSTHVLAMALTRPGTSQHMTGARAHVSTRTLYASLGAGQAVR